MDKIAKVALAIPFTEPFDYRLTEELGDLAKPGSRAVVSVGRRVMVGTIVEILYSSPFTELKNVSEIVDIEPLFSATMLSLTRWISDYYLVSWGEVLDASVPGGLKPKIVKTLFIDKNLSERLSPPEYEWILSQSQKTEKTIRADQDYSAYRKQFSQWLKDGTARFQFSVNRAKVSPNEAVQVQLNQDALATLKTRKGSKASQVIELLTVRGPVLMEDIQRSIPGCTPIIKQLKEKDVIQEEKVIKPLPDNKQIPEKDTFITLNQEQRVAFERIQSRILSQVFQVFLLYGVTGSGKTEVYLHAVRETLSQKRTVLILIPEISLTHQIVSRFKDRFCERIAVLHSGMGESERFNEWWKIKNGESDIAIGARSAIFSPLENIGLIVVDEEHDNSYKQQESPFYNARDIAVKLGHDHNAVVILGSATPSIESYNNAQNKKYERLTLSTRANRKPLPPITIINLKEEKRQDGVFYLSKFLVSSLKENLDRGKQALVFLNRRGYAAFLSCKECELPVLCDNCSIALTWHQKEKRLICHHCGFKLPFQKHCPTCGSESLKLDGIGTERIERDLSLLFPAARFLRMDRDTVQRKGVLEKNIDIINQHEVDFIIGTQLISKGHDFKQVGLVCVILADIGLNIPDFRSSERSFQLLSQVSGRAGRDESGKGMVIVQTYNPEHFAITSAVENNVPAFIDRELELRQVLRNPPSVRMILIKISDTILKNVEITATQLGKILISQSSDSGFEVLGPIESPISKINRRYYWQILVKADDTRSVKRYLRFLFWEQKEWRPIGSTRVSIDVDPYFLG